MKRVHFIRFAGCFAALIFTGTAVAATAPKTIAERVIRTEAAGVEIYIYPMGVKDVVAIAGSLPAGDAHAAQDGANPATASLVGMMLDKGTTKQDKYAIARQLDNVGAGVWFSVGQQTVTIGGRSLRKDTGRVIRLMAEQLRWPAFATEELDKLKKQIESRTRTQLDDTNFRARDAFAQSVFPAGHPNRPVPPQDWLAAVQRATLDELKAFHRKYYGPRNLRLVFTGDVDPATIRAEVRKAFAGWSGGVDVTDSARGTTQAPPEQAVSLADKASVSIVLGQATELRYQDADRLALSVGTSILGSGFTGRLMSTVRDKEGLTYGIGAGLHDDTFVNGSWMISATFAPDLLTQGVTATRRELDKWWREGVTASELEARKTNLIGSFQVGLATTFGMANSILQNLERGVGIEWLDRYPGAIDALTVEKVNAAIRKYLDPKTMTLVKAG